MTDVEHVHDFREPVVHRPSSPPFWETVVGYLCSCGERQSIPGPKVSTRIFTDPIANARMAARIHRYGAFNAGWYPAST